MKSLLVTFRSSNANADLLTFVADGIVRAFEMFGTTRAITLDISNMLFFVTNLNVMEFPVRFTALVISQQQIASADLDGKSL